MADDDGELPMYIEEDDEEEKKEAAVEREKRREEGRLWGPDKIREKMRERYGEWEKEMAARCADHPPPRRLDPEEESPELPGRYLSLGRGGPRLASSANILSVRVVRSDIGYPIDLYGTVIVRDELDGKRVYVFRRDRHNCQRIHSMDELLSLTGPCRGVLIFSNIYFEIDLKSKDNGAANDRNVGKWYLKDDTVASTCKPIRNRFVGEFCTIDLTYAPAHRAVEVAVEVKICEILRTRINKKGLIAEDWLPFNQKRKEHSEFHGNITARISGTPEDIILFDSQAPGCVIRVTNGGLLELSRRVFAVPIDQNVSLKIASQDGYHVMGFLPRINASFSIGILVGSYKLELKLIWSALFSPKEDGTHCMQHHAARSSVSVEL